MFSDLRASPEVLWGALIAFGIVVLLTPAVGGMARLLGVVDQPDARRLNKRPIPRLGGLAIFLGILVPSLAFLDLSGEMRGILLGAAVACVVGAVDDFRGLAPLPKFAGQVAAAAIPVRLRRVDRPLHLPVRRRRRPAGVGRDAADGRVDRRRDEHGQLPRRDGRPRGRRVCHLRVDVRHARALARQDRRRAAFGRGRRGVRRLPPSQLLPGPHLHGRLRRARARLHARRPSRSPDS